MILQSLASYYDRLLAEGRIELPGFQEKEVRFVIELQANGTFMSLITTGDGKRGKRFVVPAEVKKSVNIAANLLWDNPEYVFGVPRPGLTEKQAAKVPRRHAAFLKRLRDLPEPARQDAGVAAVLTFLERGDFAALKAQDAWPALSEESANVSFRLMGDEGLVCERPAVRAALAWQRTESHADPRCLVTGDRAKPARLHPSIKGVRGAQTSGANIVSYNDPPYCSHGWEQGENAPIGERAALAYTAALNHLLDRANANHKVVEGDSTFVFWAAAKTRLEDEFLYLLTGQKEQETESDGIPIKATFTTLRSGLPALSDDPTAFFVLGLVPNAARLAVRLWFEGTAAELAQRFKSHFDALDIVGLDRPGQAPSLWRLLGAAAIGGDPKKLNDNLRGRLAADIVAAILTGRSYPDTLLARTVERCRTENSVWPVRAALIKAILVRNHHQEAFVSLDPANANIGYRLGRLFAVLEALQREAQRDINTTIRDRYFGAAASAPLSVFKQLMDLKNAHLKKVRARNPGYAIRYEKLMGQIVDGIPADTGLPASLPLADQGRFIIGYHHQTNDIYAKQNQEA
jgi:CRISPR-associated protein Csd1